MSRAGIEQLLYMMDRAFAGDPATPGQQWHAVLVNLASVDPKDWSWLPENGARSILTLIEELGACKYVYDSQSFGDGSIDWNRPESMPVLPPETQPEAVLDWLREGHRRLRGHVAALEDDAELLRLRLSPQGDMRETRWIIGTIIEHDTYHSGEINHLRALRQDNDQGNEYEEATP